MRFDIAQEKRRESRRERRGKKGRGVISFARVVRRGDKTICQYRAKNKRGSEPVRREEVSEGSEKGANREASKGLRKSTKEQEISGCGPRIIERGISAGECPNYSRARKGTRVKPG
jgi:hypothetical protein